MESGMSVDDFAKAWSFCRLQIALTMNNFSSEKMISPMSVHAFTLLRRIFAQASLHFERQELQIDFNNVSYCLLTHIHITGHPSHGSFRMEPDSGSDNINNLWYPKSS